MEATDSSVAGEVVGQMVSTAVGWVVVRLCQLRFCMQEKLNVWLREAVCAASFSGDKLQWIELLVGVARRGEWMMVLWADGPKDRLLKCD